MPEIGICSKHCDAIHNSWIALWRGCVDIRRYNFYTTKSRLTFVDNLAFIDLTSDLTTVDLTTVDLTIVVRTWRWKKPRSLTVWFHSHGFAYSTRTTSIGLVSVWHILHRVYLYHHGQKHRHLFSYPHHNSADISGYYKPLDVTRWLISED